MSLKGYPGNKATGALIAEGALGMLAAIRLGSRRAAGLCLVMEPGALPCLLRQAKCDRHRAARGGR